VPFQRDARRSPTRTAVLLVGARADAGRFRIAAASVALHEPSADRFALAIDALPGDTLGAGAALLEPAAFVPYDRLMRLAFGSTQAELADALVPPALRSLARRGYDRVIALPATAFVRGPLDPLYAVLECSDVVPDPGFAIGWWGTARGTGRRVLRHHPADAELVSSRGATAKALASASVVLVDDVPARSRPEVSAALLARTDPSVELESAYRRTSLDVDGAVSGPAFRYAAFSNGVRVDAVCRALLRDGLAAGEAFDDPGDVRAPVSFFAWLTAPSATGRRLSRYLERYVALRPALRRAFPRCDVNPEPLLQHLRNHVPADLDPVWCERNPLVPAALRGPVPDSAGVNVIGYFRAELGIGEAGRSLVHALGIAGVPHAILDFSSGSSNRGGDRTIERFDDDPAHGISVLCANPDQFDLFARHPASRAFARGRYRIGAWWFELPDLPVAWQAGLACVDEIWAGSHFVQAAISRISPVPVTYIPPIVAPRSGAPVSRAEFGLADDELAYLFVFDFNSVWERKNPDGAVAAFRRAFASDGRARLLIKTINAPLHQDAYERLRGVIGTDPRIRLIDEYFDRDRLARLMQACDAYVSLHRAEGFGLTIAEAMVYGKPVVVTRWSGNLDFTTATNSFLVEGTPIRIERAHGPYYAGGLWAEPDVEAAAAAMRLIADQPGEATRRAELGRLHVRSMFSPARVGSLVRARVDAIGRMREACA
jgi:glycosyltransferase involved in cell wall biosynthesis